MADSSYDSGLVEQLLEDFLDRQRRGERPTVGEYEARHPGMGAELRAMLEAVAVIRDLGPGTVDETGSWGSGGPPSPEGRVTERVGDYRILREIGRGGMGVVYEAVQESLGRHVALKVLSWQVAGRAPQMERFRLEARAAARLHHTNIVPVFGVGEQDGVPYYAMQFIPGQGLDAVITELRRLRHGRAASLRDNARPARSPGAGAVATTSACIATYLLEGSTAVTPPDDSAGSRDAAVAGPTPAPPSPGPADTPSVPTRHPELVSTAERRYYRELARIGLQVAEALAHAHAQGVLHRDIKPSNLLLDAHGAAWVADFGLAKAEGADGPTRTGDIVGTLRYMAPERFEGRSDPRGDVYGLGATLYELITLRSAFGEADQARLIERILNEPPAPPRRLDPRIPRDLETICLKCLEKDPARRYRSADELARDLRRFLEGQPILARPVGLLERAMMWARRRPAVASLLAGMLLLALTAGFFAYRSHLGDRGRQAERRQHALDALDRALLLALNGDLGAAERAIADSELLGASAGDVRLARGQIAYYRGELESAIEHLEQAARLQPDRVAPRALLTAVCQEGGYVERYYELLTGLETLIPVTADDHLFLGLAKGFETPERGLAAMDEAIRRHNSPVARALRARSRAYAALATGDSSYARLAVEDARIARTMLSDSAFALTQDLISQLAAAGTFEGPGLADDRDAALAQADRDARALERVNSLPIASTALMWYFRETGNHAAALAQAFVRLRSGVRMSPFEELSLAMELHHHGEFRPALEALGRIIARGGDTSCYQICRCYTLAELPDGPARALEAYRELRLRGVFAIYAPTILQLLGRKDEALAAHQAVRQQGLRIPVRPAWVDRLLEFNAGLIPADELLAAAGTSRLNRCEAHFFIGMALLADGDRDGACDHFRRSVATHAFSFFDHVWSRAFLARLEQDPTWPPWIPVKK